MPYDEDDSPIKPRQPYTPVFADGYSIITEYEPRLCELLIEHGRAGLFIETFIGRYNISNKKFNEWISEDSEDYQDFKAAYSIAISAAIYVWNAKLSNAVDAGDWQAVAQIKAILSEMMKAMPSKQIRESFTDGYNQETPQQKGKKGQVRVQNKLIGILGGGN